jgi:hypothetical protein
LEANLSITKDIYKGTGIVFYLDPTVFINEKDSNMGGQADIMIDNDHFYPEIASFAANMSSVRREGYYLTSAAIGILRLGSIIRKHGLTPRRVDLLDFGLIKDKVSHYRETIGADNITYAIPFYEMYPGFRVGLASSPSTPVSGMGGINLTNLPIINLADFNFGSVSSLPMATFSIDQELEEIQKLITANIRPSKQRIVEFLHAYTHTQPSSFSLNNVLSCVADILRLEEG